MEKNYTKGSEWRKWDLHIHTPESICQKYGGEQAWDKFIDALERLPEDVKVIGITDYYFIDGFSKVMDYKMKGRLENIDKIFPILEFRIDTFGSGNENSLQKINLHILFNIDDEKYKSEIEKIKKEFIAQIPITKLDKHKTKMLSKENLICEGNNDLQKGFSNLIPSTEKVFELINSLAWKDKTFLFLGYKEWSNLEKGNQIKPLKEDIYDKVHAFFTSNPKTIEKSQSWLNEYGTKRLLHSGDIHDFDYLDTANQDKQGEYIPTINYSCNTWIKANPTFEGLKQIIYEPEERVAIQEIKPEEKAGYQAIDSVKISHKDFLQQTVELNQNLNSIIGGRSTGKSILLGCIAKRLNSLQDVKYDNEEYTNYVNEIVKSIEILWKDNTIDNNRDIEYFPQSYMYNLAKDRNGLDNLINDIIKQDPIKNNLISSYKSFCSDNNTEITNKINKLFQLNNDLRDKNNILKEKGDKKGIETEIERLTKELSELKDKSQISPENLSEYNNLKSSHDSLIKKLQIITEEILKIETLKTKFFINNNIEFELIALEDKNKEAIKTSFDKLKTEFQKQWEVEISAIVKLNEEEKIRIQDSINVIIVNSTYKIGLEAFQNNTQFKNVEEKLKIQKDKLADISKIDKEVTDLKTQIVTFKKGIVEANYAYFNKINEIKEGLSITKDKLIINAIPKFREKEFKDILNWSINQQSYQGQDIVNIKIKTNDYFFKNIKDLFDKLLNNSIVILMLLLDFSTKDCPILIDQPEDDLDNRAIYRELVTYLKKKKKERQIIVVTHNPNIVVSADSELVVVANQNGTGTPNENNNKFQYLSGSLEFTKEPIKPREKDDPSPILEY